MSTIISGPAIRTSQFGVQLIKAAQVLPQTLNTPLTLATVTGGAVLITSMLGLVTVACGATATNLSIGTIPSVGASSSTGIMAATPSQARPSVPGLAWCSLPVSVLSA